MNFSTSWTKRPFNICWQDFADSNKVVSSLRKATRKLWFDLSSVIRIYRQLIYCSQGLLSPAGGSFVTMSRSLWTLGSTVIEKWHNYIGNNPTKYICCYCRLSLQKNKWYFTLQYNDNQQQRNALGYIAFIRTAPIRFFMIQKGTATLYSVINNQRKVTFSTLYWDGEW